MHTQIYVSSGESAEQVGFRARQPKEKKARPSGMSPKEKHFLGYAMG
jgi:hypothetical protein